ncbi:MAG: glycosyltransferase family 9 protein, partial [Cytophagales bacterium]|nr:glycosyltransferase family 9 protein [Cytophagales bacterium]
YFDLEVYSSYSSMMTTLSTARNRYGFFRKSTNFRKGLHTNLVFFNTNQHIMYNYVQLGGLVNAYSENFELQLPIVFPHDKDNGDKVIGDFGYEFIVINVNASDLLLERRWPASYYAELLDRLVINYSFPVLLIGSKGEREYVNSVLSQCKTKSDKIINLAGRTSLGDLIYILGKAKLVITNDSGPFHLSVANKVPTLSLWGPVSTVHYGPLDKVLNKTISVNIFCSPCLHHTENPPCGGDNQCMKLISVDSVYNELEYFFKHLVWQDDQKIKKLYLASAEGKVYGNTEM